MINKNRKINYLATGVLGVKYFRKIKKKDLQGKVKHIQLNVRKEGKDEGKNYLIAGNDGHPGLLETSLHRFGLSYETKMFKGEEGSPEEEIPEEIGDEYKMFGAGRVSNGPIGVEFNDRSFHYLPLSTDKKDLIERFGEENVEGYEGIEFPSFSVKGIFGKRNG